MMSTLLKGGLESLKTRFRVEVTAIVDLDRWYDSLRSMRAEQALRVAS